MIIQSLKGTLFYSYLAGRPGSCYQMFWKDGEIDATRVADKKKKIKQMSCQPRTYTPLRIPPLL